MEKLKKLFPLSFKYCRDVKGLILGTLFYILIGTGVNIGVSLVIQPIIDTVIGMLFAIFYVIAIVLLVVGAALSYLVVGVPILIIGYILLILVAVIHVTIVSTIMGIFSSFVSVYVFAGSIISILAYGGVFGEIPEEKKVEKKADELPEAEVKAEED